MWYCYRKNGGQIVGASTEEHAPWTEDAYYGIYASDDAVRLSEPYWCDGTVLRPATEDEVAMFVDAMQRDAVARLRDDAKGITSAQNAIDGTSRAFRALSKVLLSEINAIRKELKLSSRSSTTFRRAFENAIDKE